MGKIAPIPLATLIVVTGRPGSGKTTLAHALARALRCPAICRDEIKEGLLHTTARDGAPTDDAELARRAYEAFFDTINQLLGHRVTLVAEAAFQHRLWSPKLGPLQDAARVRIVVCTVDAALARARCIERETADPDRARFHPDPAVHAHREGRESALNEYDPPRLDVPTLTVDTSDGYRPPLEEIVRFACA